MATDNEHQIEKPPSKPVDIAAKANKQSTGFKNVLVWGFIVVMVFSIPAIYMLAKYVLATTAS